MNHSFGNGQHGIHQILNRFGIRYVATDLNKAKMHRPRQHPLMAWEQDVLLMERGKAPVPWHLRAASPQFAFDHCILNLHWANLLHEDVRRNMEVIRQWIGFIKNGLDPMEQVLAPDTATCWSQFAYRTLSQIRQSGNQFEIDIRKLCQLPRKTILPYFYIKLQSPRPVAWRVEGAQMQAVADQAGPIQLVTIVPENNTGRIRLTPLNV